MAIHEMRKLLRALFIGLSAVFFLQSSIAQAARGGFTTASLSDNGGNILIGLGAPSYFQNGPPFLNWAQSAGGGNQYTINLTAGGAMPLTTAFATGVLDTNGELVAGSGLSGISSISKGVFTPTPFTPFLSVFASPPGQWWTGLQMKITWTGTSSPFLGGGSSIGTGSTALSCGTNSCTFTFGSNPNNVAFGFPVSNVNDPPKNIFIYEVQYQTQVTALATCVQATNCNHFRPVWLAAISAFGRHRYMDWVNANGAGPYGITALADWNYQICIACDYSGIQIITASTNGDVLTVSGVQVGAPTLGPNLLLTDISASLAAGTMITSGTLCGGVACTGTGGAGTYLINISQTVSSETMLTAATTGYAGPLCTGGSCQLQSGIKGSVHPVVAEELARLTRGQVYYNLPANLTDAGFQGIDQHFAANLPSGTKIVYEHGNENWNGALGVNFGYLSVAGTPKFGANNGVEWSGYRMTQLMSLARADWGADAYNQFRNPNGRWSGIVEDHMTTTTETSAAFLAGSQQWLTDNSSTLLLGQLFSESIVAPYFSDFPGSLQISAVTPGTTTTITTGGSYTIGQVVKLFFNDTTAGTVGSVLNAQYVTVTAAPSNGFAFTNISTAGLTYTNTGSINDFVAADNLNVKPLFDMAEANNACFASSAATIGSGSITGNALSTSSVTGGPIVAGQGLSGLPGIPANTSIISGSGSSWLLNNLVSGPVTGSMTTAPCATPFQFFAMEISKAIITGTNDFGYTPDIPQTQFNLTFENHQLFSYTYGFSMSQYEGTNQFLMSGEMGAVDNLGSLIVSWKWDAAGNDPLYTPAKVLQNQFQMMRNLSLPFSGVYQDMNGGAMQFSGLRYYGDTNPYWSAILAENAAGRPVDPTPTFSWAATYPGNSTNRIFNDSGCSPCSDTSSTITIGTPATKAIVVVTLTGGTATSATCDGVTSSTPDAVSVNAGRTAAIFSMNLSAGSNQRTCTVFSSGSAFQFREFYVMTVNGLTNNAPVSINPSNPDAPFTVNYPKGSLIVAAGACQGSFANISGVSTPSVSSPVTATIASDIDAVNGTAEFGMFKAPFSSPIFSISGGCGQAQAGAVYNFLLKRDIDPISNDNDPMWLGKAA